jgi:nitrite reductase (NADH) small subunit
MGTRGRSADQEIWSPVCPAEDLAVGRGIAALVAGHAVAVVRAEDGQVHAVGNHDPLDKAAILSRGIVGQRDGVAFVASPRTKRAYDLATGVCLADDQIHVPVYGVKFEGGIVYVGPRLTTQGTGAER